MTEVNYNYIWWNGAEEVRISLWGGQWGYLYDYMQVHEPSAGDGGVLASVSHDFCMLTGLTNGCPPTNVSLTYRVNKNAPAWWWLSHSDGGWSWCLSWVPLTLGLGTWCHCGRASADCHHWLVQHCAARRNKSVAKVVGVVLYYSFPNGLHKLLRMFCVLIFQRLSRLPQCNMLFFISVR